MYVRFAVLQYPFNELQRLFFRPCPAFFPHASGKPFASKVLAVINKHIFKKPIPVDALSKRPHNCQRVRHHINPPAGNGAASHIHKKRNPRPEDASFVCDDKIEDMMVAAAPFHRLKQGVVALDVRIEFIVIGFLPFPIKDFDRVRNFFDVPVDGNVFEVIAELR